MFNNSVFSIGGCTGDIFLLKINRNGSIQTPINQYRAVNISRDWMLFVTRNVVVIGGFSET